MSTPYTPPDAGTAVLFPPASGVAAFDHSTPDLAEAASALYFNDETRWPALSADGGSQIPLKTTMVDSPDGAELANWLAHTRLNWLQGADIPVPDVASYEESGTLPYVNPATSDNPDAIFALNYLVDNL